MGSTNTVFLLMAQTDGKLSLSVEELASILGCGKQTIYNEVSAGVFPIPTQKRGGRLVADIRDVAAYLDIQRENAIKAHEDLRRKMSTMPE